MPDQMNVLLHGLTAFFVNKKGGVNVIGTTNSWCLHYCSLFWFALLDHSPFQRPEKQEMWPNCQKWYGWTRFAQWIWSLCTDVIISDTWPHSTLSPICHTPRLRPTKSLWLSGTPQHIRWSVGAIHSEHGWLSGAFFPLKRLHNNNYDGCL